MKHSIRQRVINQYGLPVVKVEQVNGELGSGILDKNGREIFEGDIVKYGVYQFTVVWDEFGGLALGASNKPLESFYNFFSGDDCDLEIIGHVGD